MIRKLILTLIVTVSILGSGVVAAPAYAVDILNGGGGASSGPCNNPNAASKPEICGDNRTGSNTNPIVGPDGILTSAINILSLIIGVTSVIIIAIEGLRMMLANGDAGTVSNTRRGIIYACVGLVIALVSQGAVALVLNKL
jgi:hypothetical protein